jgi:formylglycine-generating enzyme required for sulfatase activity
MRNSNRSAAAILCVLGLASWSMAAEIASPPDTELVANKLQPVQTFKDCPDCPVMVVVPPGSYQMGSNVGEADEKPVHRVTIGKPFAIGKFEVTQAEWQAVMGNNPSDFKNCGSDCPVERVSWYDVQEFIHKLNLKTGKQYRLPTEAEWEYACRAGQQTEYCGGDDLNSIGWYGAHAISGGNSAMTTNPVGQKQANAFGLYDMSGNMWEWVQDSYHSNYNGAPNDGSEWDGDGAIRVVRGGSWSSTKTTASTRLRLLPSYRISVGFRLASSLP